MFVQTHKLKLLGEDQLHAVWLISIILRICHGLLLVPLDILSNGRNSKNSFLVPFFGGISKAMFGGPSEGLLRSGALQSVLALHAVIGVPLVPGKLSPKSGIFVDPRICLE